MSSIQFRKQASSTALNIDSEISISKKESLTNLKKLFFEILVTTLNSSEYLFLALVFIKF